MQKGT